MSRRDANLDISDRIALALNLPAELTHEIEKHEQYICNETLSNSLIFVPHLTDFEYSYKYDFHFRPIEIAFSLIAPGQGKEFNP
jgi:hypothetical protein